MLVAALTVDSLGNGLFLPLSLVFFLELTDVPLALLGVLLTLANAVSLPFPIWAGTLADRYGPLPVVVAAQLLQAVGFLAYAHVDGALGVFAAATLVAIGVRFFWSTVFTAVADYADGSTGAWALDTWYSISNGARTAGLAVGGLITGIVVADGRAGTYVAVAYAAAACFAVAGALIAIFVRTPRARHHTDPQQEAASYRALVRDRPFLALIAVNTVFALASIMLGLALPTVVLQVVQGPAWLTAGILAGNALLIALLAGPVGVRLPHYRRTRVIVLAAGLWTIWALAMALLGPIPQGVLAAVLIAVTVLFTVAEVLHAPASMALASDAAPGNLRGRYLATFQYSFTVASIVAPAFFTTLFALNPAVPWLALGLLVALGGLALLRLERVLGAPSQQA